MANENWTKGEWQIARATDTNTMTLIIGGDNGVVADTFFRWRRKDICEANAQLIKSAPKLYEATKIALGLVKTVLYEHPDDEIAQAQRQVIENALKEARGENA